MTEWWLPAGAAVAAVALTYFFCLRPMRRGHCAGNQPSQSSKAQELDQALDRAHHELARLRADAHQNMSGTPDTSPMTRAPILKEDHR